MLKQQNNKKIENAFFISALLFVFKIIFPSADTFFLVLINESLVLLSIYLWLVYVSEFVNPQLSKPLSLVINAGLLTGLSFLLMSASDWLTKGIINSTGFISVLFSYLIAFIFIGVLTYIFSVYKKLCFYRQKKNPEFYFNIMLVFFLIIGVYSSFNALSHNKNYFTRYDFFVVFFDVIYGAAFLLIFLNSLRVAWIAFLSKKQKTNLLIISFFMIIFSWINFGILSGNDFKILYSFSPLLSQMLEFVMAYGGIYFIVIFFTTLFHLPTAEAIDRKNEELSSFESISRLMSQVFDSEELYETITSTILKASNSDAAWLLIKKGDTYGIHSVKGLKKNEAELISNTLIENQKISYSKVKVLSNNELLYKKDFTENISAIVAAPLSVHNLNKGFLFAARKTFYRYEEEESKSVSTFANFAAIALENSKLLEESIEKERLEKELDVARDVQYKLLPQKTPEYKNLDINALFVPAMEVGGDYYDFFEVGNNKLGVVIADVSGKGIEAAFVMAEVKGVFASLTKLNLDAKELLIKANAVLEKSLPKKIFVTVLYGIFDLKNQKFNFARAGHAPLIYSNGGGIKKLTPEGIGLGLAATNKFADLLKEMEIKLNNNDIIILFTDGINETLNEHLEEFGYERFEKIILENKNLSADSLSNKIMESVFTFSKNSIQHDDITLVILKWKNNNKKAEEN